MKFLISLILVISSFVFAEEKMPTQSAFVNPVPAATQSLTSRDWFIDPTGLLLSIDFGDKYTPSSGGSADTESRMKIYVLGGRNYGLYEVGPVFEYDSLSTNSGSSVLTLFGAFGRYNFIPNVPGNNVIPYMRLDYLMGNNKYTGASGSGNYQDSIQATHVRGGVSYFPFGQILAVEADLDYRIYSNSYDARYASGTWNGFFLNGNVKLYF